MLTRKQHELILFIHRRLTEDGVSPSFDEMKEALQLRSKSGIHRLITGLEERGFIRRLPHRARALEVLRLPDGAKAGPGNPPRGILAPNVIKGDFGHAMPGRPAGATEDGEVGSVQLPLYGRIAAGTPIEALRDQTSFSDVPASLLTRGGDHYTLQVEGDSMVDAGILDGDVVVVRKVDTAENGAIVVALIDNGEVTLKRLRKKGNTIALEPANPCYETRIFGPDRVQVQGRLVGLVRRYE